MLQIMADFDDGNDIIVSLIYIYRILELMSLFREYCLFNYRLGSTLN